MRKTNLRLHGIAVPLACLTAMCLGAGDVGFMLILTYLLASVLSLGAPDAFHRASAKLMSTRKVMGALLIAILMIALGCGAAFVLWRGLFDLTNLFWLIAGGMMAVVRCFEELFVSQGDETSARITDALSFIALTACLLIPMNELVQAEVVLIVSAVLLVISGAIGLGFARKELLQLNWAIFREIPAALLRTLLFPAVWLVAMVFTITASLILDGGALPEGIYLTQYAPFAGLIFMEMAKSTFRRDKFESAGLKIGVAVSELLISLAIFAAAMFLPVYGAAAAMVLMLLAGVCAMILYAPFDWESIAATLVMLAGSALTCVGVTPEYCSFPYEVFIGPIVGLILCILMLRQWGELFRARRANRIRKKAMKRSRS